MTKALWAVLGWKGAIALLSSVLLAVGVWGQVRYSQGYESGKAALQARVLQDQLAFQAKLSKVRSDLAEKSAALDAATLDQQSRIERIEREAINDSDAINRKPSPDSLHRLDNRWRGPQ